MKNTVIEWLLVIFLLANMVSFFITGSLFALVMTGLMLWLNWDFYVTLVNRIKYRYFR